MKTLELQKLIREEIQIALKEAKEVVLSNEILDLLQDRGYISGTNAQKVHKELTAFLKGKIS